MNLHFFILPLCTAVALTTADQSDASAHIVRQLNNVNPDGSYNYAYETSNAIFAEEQGFPRDQDGYVVQGQYQYTSPKGHTVALTYVADDVGGFRAQGAHLPTPPPVPPLIQKALDYLNGLERSKRQQ